MSGAVVTFANAVAAARRALVADGGALWGFDVSDARWVGALDGVWHATSDPKIKEFLWHGELGLWSGEAPAGDVPANTAFDWVGHRWARIWLAGGCDARLLLHEAWHAQVQPRLLGARSPDEGSMDGADLLDRADGRVWLRLELDALRRALAAMDDEAWHFEAAAALAFRDRRDQIATPAERDRQQVLEITERLAEYSAWRWSGAADIDVAVHVGADPPLSWVRAFCYRTGPAYGFLLDRADPAGGWRSATSGPHTLADFMARVVDPAADVDGAATSHGLESVRTEERRRDELVTTGLPRLREKFVDGPVLRVPVLGRPVSFNPQGDTALREGTVRRSVQWATQDGSRLVAQEAMLVSDWSELHIPIGQTPLDGRDVTGPGWRLTLAPGWRIVDVGRNWLAQPPPGRDSGPGGA